jgi:hypothetical protein
LAAQLLAAELNLNVGAESCPIAEEAVIGAHIILSSMDFEGNGEYAPDLTSELAESIEQIMELLAQYNSGELCIIGMLI